MQRDKYYLLRALRPFSFSVALVVCSTGILAACQEGHCDPLLASLLLIAGLALQAGVNLINDYADLAFVHEAPARKRIQRNFIYGNLCFLLSASIGLYLTLVSGPLLLWISALGVVGALGYTFEPINYKRRGLAVILVFWFMGVLMVCGSYYVLTTELTLRVFYLSLPVSLFTSLLLLSNEIRDYEDDRENGIRTLTVRIGFKPAVVLYVLGLVCVYLLCIWLSVMDILPQALWTLLSVPLTILPLLYLSHSQEKRLKLTPATGKLFMLFGVLYCGALVV